MEEQKDHFTNQESAESHITDADSMIDVEENTVNAANKPVIGQVKRTDRVFQSFKKRPNTAYLLATIFILLFAGIGALFIFSSFAQDEEIKEAKINAFNITTDNLKANARAYQSKMPNQQKPKIEELMKAAKDRKNEALRLIRTSPNIFLTSTISKADKQNMPKEVQQYIEDEVDVTGKYVNGRLEAFNGKMYNLNYSKSSKLDIHDPQTYLDIRGYAFGDELVFKANEQGYTPKVKNTTTKTPPSNVKFTGTPVSGGITTGTGTATFGPGENVISGVPGYGWRDGCGPTAVAMIVGYYDGQGYDNLVEGSATGQTASASIGTDPVNQMIASHATTADPFQHYEDYSLPRETTSGVFNPDKSEPPLGDEHVSNSVADFMHTSWSAERLGYGWSWSSDVAPAFISYVKSKYPNVTPLIEVYGGTSVTLDLLKQEVSAKRPMVFLVDSNGDGATDHFVTVVGYRETNGYPEYASWDTWNTGQIRWQQLRSTSGTYQWGVYAAYKISMTGGNIPVINSFSAIPNIISLGQAVKLSWDVTGATQSVCIDSLYCFGSDTTSYIVYPNSSTTYTLTAKNSSYSVQKSVTVTVNPAPTPTPSTNPTPTSTPTPTPKDIIPPIVTISGVNNGASYSSGKITVTGNAFDESGIAKIEIYLNNKLVATCNNTTICSYALNVKKLNKGSHVFKVVAFDKASPSNNSYNILYINRI